MLFRVWIYSHHKSHKILLEFTDSMRKLRRVGELHSFYAAFGFYKFVCPRPPISSVPVTPLYTDLHRYKNKNTLWAEEIRGTLAGNFFGFSTQKLACFCHREHQTVISATIRRRYSSTPTSIDTKIKILSELKRFVVLLRAIFLASVPKSWPAFVIGNTRLWFLQRSGVGTAVQEIDIMEPN